MCSVRCVFWRRRVAKEMDIAGASNERDGVWKGGGSTGYGVNGEKPGERLPGDVLDRIQACLPITDFFRSRLVCKSWHSNLLSHAFRKMHAELAAKEKWVLTLARCDHGRDIHNFPCAYNPVSNKWVRLPLTCFCPNGASGNFLASGGMVCFQEGTESSRNVIVCDPCLGSRNAVPVPSFMADSELQLVGFVRDRGSKEFKVFGICFTSPEQPAPTVVYDSRKGAWAVTGTAFVSMTRQIERSVVWGGCLYVVGRGSRGWGGRSYEVLKCKVEDGVWRRVPASFVIHGGTSRVEPGLDLVVHNNRLFLIGKVEGENAEEDAFEYFPIMSGCIVWEVVETEPDLRVGSARRAPSYFTEDWAGAFAGRDGLLYIQLSDTSPRVVVCDLWTAPYSWWLLPPSPAAEQQCHGGVSFVTMPVEPELDAFVGSQS